MPRKPRTTPAADETVDTDVEDVEVEDTADVEEDTDVEVDDTADDVDDLEVEDEEDEPEPAAKPTRAKKAPADKPAAKPIQPPIEFGSAWLAEHVNAETGSSFNAFGIRTLLRKLVKDGKVARDVGTDRSRYNFTAGAKDPIVREVVKYVKSGAAEAEKKAKIAEAKEAAATAAAAKPKTAKAKAKPAPEPEVEDDEDDEIEDL